MGVNINSLPRTTFDFILYHLGEHIPRRQQLAISMQRKNMTAPHLTFHTPVSVAYSQ